MRPGTAPGPEVWGFGHALSEVGRPGTSALDKRDKKKKKKKSKKDKKNRRSKKLTLFAPPKLNAEKSIEERQIIVDKLGSKANALEVQLRKQIKAIETIKLRTLEEKRKRKQMGGVKALKIVEHSVAKQIRILENRLNKINIRSCEFKAENDKTYQQINGLRQERLTFERGFKKLDRAFKKKQHEMGIILTKSDEFYNARQSALQELSQLKIEAEDEEADFIHEFEELGKVISEQVQMTNYNAHTNNKRKRKEMEAMLASGNLDAEEELKLRTRLEQLSQEGKRHENVIQSNDQNMKSYEDAFQTLYDHSGVDDIQVIVDTFVQNEDENFSLFSFVQQTNRVTEKDEEELRRVQDEMEKYKSELSQADSNRENIVNELKARLQKIRAQSESLDEVLGERKHALESIAQATETFFHAVGCPSMRGLEGFRASDKPTSENPALAEPDSSSPTSPNPAVGSETRRSTRAARGSVAPASNNNNLCVRLGDSVNEDNIMLYLGVVEQRTNEIIQLYRRYCGSRPSFALRMGGSSRLSMSGLPVPTFPRGSSHVRVDAPPLENAQPTNSAAEDARAAFESKPRYVAEDEDEERPLSSEQLRELTIRQARSAAVMVPNLY